jgi:hypothetical protein
MQQMVAFALGMLLTTVPDESHHEHIQVEGFVDAAPCQAAKSSPFTHRWRAPVSFIWQLPVSGRSPAASQVAIAVPLVVPFVELQ